MTRLSAARRDGDDGTALIEFFWLGILLLVPITYAILFAFQIQRAVFAVTEATRSAGRAFVTTSDGNVTTAQTRAVTAAQLTMTDHGLTFNAADPKSLSMTCHSPSGDTSCFQADHVVTIAVQVPVQLPLLSFFGVKGKTMTVSGQHDEVFDKYADYTKVGG